PAPTIEEMREARRQNRNTRPALTKHTPVEHQRQGLAANKKRGMVCVLWIFFTTFSLITDKT
ncbi:hypothetical protein ONJ87_25360, partial [Salmonella enterica subsp. enterica serovar Anatum]|nr:hypothetical protein [Salmonella enterica subsp. enterica serovar Anatum]